MKAGTVAMILAGGRGSRLNMIAARRAKPAVPFGGPYRIIDFTLTNIMNSGIRHVGVLTQYRPTSLMEHLGDGESWGLNALGSSLKVLPPQFGGRYSDWYKGTADAVFRNLDFLEGLGPEHVLVLSGDHVYRMDYSGMVAHHVDTGSDITIAAMKVAWEETSRFGVMVTAGDGEVVRFVEKPKEPVSDLANMGIYVFRYDVLVEELLRCCPAGGFDFGADVIPGMLGRRKVTTYGFDGYWRDVGTLGSYWSANMDALDPGSGLDLGAWRVRTNQEGRGQVYHPPLFVGPKALVKNSLLSRGCWVEGTVVDSVLSPGVTVAGGASVTSSVVMHDCVIEQGARVERAILDKDVVVGAGARVGRADARAGVNSRFPTHLSGGITVVGKATRLPRGTRVGANALIGTGLGPDDFSGDVDDGSCLPDEGK